MAGDVSLDVVRSVESLRGIRHVDVSPVRDAKKYLREYVAYLCTRQLKGKFVEGKSSLACEVRTTLTDYIQNKDKKLLIGFTELENVLRRKAGSEGKKLLERLDISNIYIPDELKWVMKVQL